MAEGSGKAGGDPLSRVRGGRQGGRRRPARLRGRADRRGQQSGQEEWADATLSTPGIPSRSQVVGIARQVMGLDDRIEQLEDRLDALMTRMDDLFKALGEHEEAAARRATRKEAPGETR